MKIHQTYATLPQIESALDELELRLVQSIWALESLVAQQNETLRGLDERIQSIQAPIITFSPDSNEGNLIGNK